MEKNVEVLALVNAPIDHRYEDSTSIFYPPLGLMAIKAYIEQNNDSIVVELLDGMILEQNEILKKLEKIKPNMVGVSVQLLSYKNAVKICRIAKEWGAITFMGGHHATQLYNNILRNKYKWVDYVVRGDGEIAVNMLCQKEDTRQIPNLAFYEVNSNKIVANKMINYRLDQMVNPYLAKDIDITRYVVNLQKSKFGYRKGRYFRIYSHKGCSFRRNGKRCVFCGRADEGYRFFSVENYFRMIQSLGLSEGDYLFDVGDDLLGNDKWLRMAVEYKEKNGVFIDSMGIFGRGDEITYDRAKLIYLLGVRDVTVGVESGDNKVLSNVEKEIYGADVFYHAAKILFQNGVGMTPSYVLGLPGETKKSVHNTVKHAAKIKELSIDILGTPPSEMVANLLEPIPGSHAYETLKEVFPEKYLETDELELEQMQRDYICVTHQFNNSEYKEYRAFLCEAGKEINTMVGFADPQGWLSGEMKGD